MCRLERRHPPTKHPPASPGQAHDGLPRPYISKPARFTPCGLFRLSPRWLRPTLARPGSPRWAFLFWGSDAQRYCRRSWRDAEEGARRRPEWRATSRLAVAFRQRADSVHQHGVRRSAQPNPTAQGLAVSARLIYRRVLAFRPGDRALLFMEVIWLTNRLSCCARFWKS